MEIWLMMSNNVIESLVGVGEKLEINVLKMGNSLTHT